MSRAVSSKGPAEPPYSHNNPKRAGASCALPEALAQTLWCLQIHRSAPSIGTQHHVQGAAALPGGFFSLQALTAAQGGCQGLP